MKFVIINHSRLPELEVFHGHATLLSCNPTMPFPIAFLFIEARTRGYWPDQPDRHLHVQRAKTPYALSLPPPSIIDETMAANASTVGRGAWSSAGASYDGKGTIHLSDPFANPKELEELMAGYRRLPTWKAAIVEGTSWAGTAEENIALYRREILAELESDCGMSSFSTGFGSRRG